VGGATRLVRWGSRKVERTSIPANSSALIEPLESGRNALP
jgi:hypothetical protein